MNNKNILLISLRGDIGGGPRHIYSILENLKNDFNFFVACPKEKPYGIEWQNKFSALNRFIELPHRKFSIISFLKLFSFVKRNKIKIVHAHGRGAGLYGRLLKLFFLDIKIIYTFHGFNIELFSQINKKFILTIERILASLTDLFINVSENENNFCLQLKLFNKNKSVIIYNGVQDEYNKIKDARLIRQDLSLPENKFIIVCITRFDRIKNLDAFVAIANLMKNEKDILFVLSGDGEDMEKVKSTINIYNLKNILLTGFINNPIDYIIASDIYLTTSIAEGLPYSLIDAIMCGKPVVASNVRGNNEVIINKFNGLLFELSDLYNAVNHIQQIKNDKNFYNFLSVNARKHYIQNFSEEKMILQIKSLYERFMQ